MLYILETSSRNVAELIRSNMFKLMKIINLYDFCKGIFSASTNWKNHENFLDIGKPYMSIVMTQTDSELACIIREKTFSSHSQLQEHVIILTKEKLHKCNVCQKLFARRRALQSHKRTHLDPEDKQYECSICKKKFLTEKSFMYYLNTDSKVKSYKCNSCDTGFSNLRRLLTPERIHTDNAFTCAICKKLFATCGELRSHTKTHLDPKDKQYECSICKKKFFTERKLKYHQNTHSTVKPYKCNSCETRFSNPKTLSAHTRIHTETASICIICGKKFNTASHLRVHAIIHTNEKPYQCNVCQKLFARRGDLQSHTRTHLNDNDKQYECSICGKKFFSEKTLNYHKNTHSNVKPYKCNFCETRFCYPASVLAHAKIHTDNVFICAICNKKFKSAGHLGQHEKIHTNEKLYQCNICQKLFARLGDLQSHTRIHLDPYDKIYECSTRGMFSPSTG